MGIIDEEISRLAKVSSNNLKRSILMYMDHSNVKELRNSEISTDLGLNGGYPSRDGGICHKGHITKQFLHMLKRDGLVEQNPKNKKWFLKK